MTVSLFIEIVSVTNPLMYLPSVLLMKSCVSCACMFG